MNDDLSQVWRLQQDLEHEIGALAKKGREDGLDGVGSVGADPGRIPNESDINLSDVLHRRKGSIGDLAEGLNIGVRNQYMSHIDSSKEMTCLLEERRVGEATSRVDT